MGMTDEEAREEVEAMKQEPQYHAERKGQAMARARRSTAPHAPLETQLEELERKVATLEETLRTVITASQSTLQVVRMLVRRG